jgi:hypothetical protein
MLSAKNIVNRDSVPECNSMVQPLVRLLQQCRRFLKRLVQFPKMTFISGHVSSPFMFTKKQKPAEAGALVRTCATQL